MSNLGVSRNIAPIKLYYRIVSDKVIILWSTLFLNQTKHTNKHTIVPFDVAAAEHLKTHRRPRNFHAMAESRFVSRRTGNASWRNVSG